MGKYFKSLDYTVKITPPYGIIPSKGMEGMCEGEQCKMREKQEMRWKRIIKARLSMSRNHIMTIDINRGRVTCSLYAMGLTKEEKTQFGRICEDVIMDEANKIELV